MLKGWGKKKQKKNSLSPRHHQVFALHARWRTGGRGAVKKKCCAVLIPNSRKAPLPATVGFAEPLCFPSQIWILLTLGRSYVHSRSRETALWEKWLSLWWISVQPTPFATHGNPTLKAFFFSASALQGWKTRLIFLFFYFIYGWVPLFASYRLSLSVNGIHSSLSRQNTHMKRDILFQGQ